MKITVLGCGGSGGVPTLMGDWGRCDPAEPRNSRTRPSILVEDGGTVLLVDTGADLRQQLLRARPPCIDGILYTHAHADHINGFDDIRYINLAQNKAVEIYGPAAMMTELRHRFAYAFAGGDNAKGFFRPTVNCHVLDGPARCGDIAFDSFTQDHGYSASMGYRFGDFAYSTDVKNLDEAAFAKLQGVKVWIVDALRHEPHPTHSHVAQTLEWIARVAPARAYLTHMNQLLDYRSLAAMLPPGVEPAYDGLVIDI